MLEKYTPPNAAAGVDEREQFWFTVELERLSSSGSVRLASKDPVDKPIIDPNFLPNEIDFERLIDGKIKYVVEH